MATKVTHAPSLEGQDRTNTLLEGMNSSLAVLALAASGTTAETQDITFQGILNGKDNTTETFYQWLAVASIAEEDKYKLLCRWFTILKKKIAGKVYTVRLFSETGGDSSTGTAMDDLAALGKGALATESDAGGADWTEEHPLTWYIRVNGYSDVDGTLAVKAIEGTEDFDITGTLAPVMTVSMALWQKETRDASYILKSWTSMRQAGFRPAAGDVDFDGNPRPITWHPTFPGGWIGDKLTSGAGLMPGIFKSATAGHAGAQKWGTHMTLWNDTDAAFVIDQWQLRQQDKENSNICEGCTSYNLQVKVGTVEEQTTRVLLPETEYDRWLEGSTVCVGSYGASNIDRGQATMHDIVDLAIILSKAKVNVGGTNYTALNLDVAKPFSTVTEARVSTMPWRSGVTEVLPGHRDGALGGLKDSRRPIRVAGIELMHGAYDVGYEPLYTVEAGSDDTHKNYTKVSICRDASKLKDAPTTDYIETGITYTGMAQGWNYVKEFVQSDGHEVVFPKTVGGSSTTYYKSAFYGSGATGVRCPFRFAHLADGGAAGLCGGDGHGAPSWSAWLGRPRLSGAGGNRGEWRA